MTSLKKVLIVERDLNSARHTLNALTPYAYTGKVVKPADALEEIDACQPDVVLVNLSPPSENERQEERHQIVRVIRLHSEVPIIVLSFGTDVLDRVLSLELGADDYLVRPFDIRELNARIKSVLRRCAPPGSEARTAERSLEYPELMINLRTYTVTFKGNPVEMTPRELAILYFLASSPNQVFTREQLLTHIWGSDYDGDVRTVDVHIKRLRAKITGNEYWNIATVWGVGYQFQYQGASV